MKDSVWRQGCGWFLFNGSRGVDIFINDSRTTISTAAVGFFLCSIWAVEQPYISFLVVKSEVIYRSNFRGMMSKFRVLKMVLRAKNIICQERKEDLQEHSIFTKKHFGQSWSRKKFVFARN